MLFYKYWAFKLGYFKSLTIILSDIICLVGKGTVDLNELRRHWLCDRNIIPLALRSCYEACHL